MIGRNGSGKTLAAKILNNVRNLMFGDYNTHQISFNQIKEIGLDWIEVELTIPLLSLEDEGFGPRLLEEVAWDIVADDFDGIWLSSIGDGDLIDGWEHEFHSYHCNLTLKIQISHLTTNPKLSIWHIMQSRGSLEIINDDEKIDDTDSHHGFHASISSEPIHFDSKISLSPKDIMVATDKRWFLWAQIVLDCLRSGMEGEILRVEYQRQLEHIAKQLDRQCMEQGFGNPDVAADEMESFNPGQQEGSIVSMITTAGERLFPKIITSAVNRTAPKLKPWKKELLEELISLRTIIDQKLQIDQFGIGCGGLLEILHDFDELKPNLPRNLIKELSDEQKQVNRLRQLFDTYEHLEKWLDFIPLYIQQRIPKKTKLEKVAIETKEFSNELLKIREHVDFIEVILHTIDECFPNFEQFQNSEDKYSILIDSISKFQHSAEIEGMYVDGVENTIRNHPNYTRDIAKSPEVTELWGKELGMIIPRYMILFWYAFEMDKDLIGLFETYISIFDSSSEQRLDLDDYEGSSWTEFLHIIEDNESLPSGFSQLLSLVLGITSDDETCIYFIDEPEISLHIDWQRKLIKHLRFLLAESRSNSMLLIATHSPDIILDHFEDLVNFSPRLDV